MYVRVYAPNGEPFDVSRDLADQLILNAGWTQTVVVDQPSDEGTEEASEKPSRRKRKTADAVPTETE